MVVIVKTAVTIHFDGTFLVFDLIILVMSFFPVGYREILVKIFFDLILVPPVKIPIFMFLLSRLTARASQPDGNITSFTLSGPSTHNIIVNIIDSIILTE